MDPLVSICCLTFNHEPYIRQCLDGFIIQKTNFNIEILIHDDASTDKTADIIREYEAKYPKTIKPIHQNENQFRKGGSISFKFQFPRAKGKYIAMCEGDDYWISDNKLQQQIDFLEAHNSFSASAHQSLILDKTGEVRDKLLSIYEKDYVLELYDLINDCNFHTSSFVFRRKVFDGEGIPPNSITSYDTYLFLLCGIKGRIKYFNDLFSVYRKHDGGISSSVTVNMIRKDVNIARYFNSKFKMFPKFAHISYTYYSIFTNVPKINFFELIFCYIMFRYYSSKSEIDISFIIREVDKHLNWRLPTFLGKVLRKTKIISRN